MLDKSEAFSGFTVDDINAAMHFYGTVLGLNVSADAMGMQIKTSGRTPIFVYEKSDHEAASYTILNFPIDSIDAAVEFLTEKGVIFERYNTLPAEQDQKGILRGKSVNQGPDIAWFKDPAGNILSVLES